VAASFLRAGGYAIEATNWRRSNYEIDIIASKSNCLVFVEVKCSRSEDFGPPELRITKTKRQRLAMAAAEYLSLLTQAPAEIRFDVISIFWPRSRPPQITHLESAFFIETD
jgi:putative endonuclease